MSSGIPSIVPEPLTSRSGLRLPLARPNAKCTRGEGRAWLAPRKTKHQSRESQEATASRLCDQLLIVQKRRPRLDPSPSLHSKLRPDPYSLRCREQLVDTTFVLREDARRRSVGPASRYPRPVSIVAEVRTPTPSESERRPARLHPPRGTIGNHPRRQSVIDRNVPVRPFQLLRRLART